MPLLLNWSFISLIILYVGVPLLIALVLDRNLVYVTKLPLVREF